MSHRVAILGAGFSGLGMAARLQDSGENSFVILEKAGSIGGTWRDNSYPGCACDVPSHLYWYSFDQQPDWSHIFSPQTEILRNLECFVERRRLATHIRFHAEVVAASWDQAQSAWRIVLASGEEVIAGALVAAWGQLNRPKLPAIDGRDSFAGSSFHSARWRHDAVLDGKRVACIGNGASAVQIIPEIAPKGESLAVFQRSPSYVVPRQDRAYTGEERTQFTTDPQSLLADRQLIYLDLESRFEAMQPASAKAAEFLGIARAHLESQIADPDLRRKLWPDYPLGCKRILVSDDFYPAMSRSNVELVTEPITRMEPPGVRTADGQLREFDVVIYATGFETTSLLGAMDIGGRDGLSLRQEWLGGAQAYLGMTVAGFPNFFMLYGPNTNLGHNSIITMLECQFDYLLQALRLSHEKQAAIEVRADAMQSFNNHLQQRLRGSAWDGGCASWYKTPGGRIVNNWCGSVEDYKAATAQLETTHYNLC